MHAILIVVLVIGGLLAVGGLTYLIARLTVGSSSYHQVTPPPPKEKPPVVHFPAPKKKSPEAKQSPLMTKYAEYKPVDQGAYIRIPNYDSSGNDIGNARDPSNYNMTLDKCKERCDKTQGCVAFGWDTGQKNYCTNKNKINEKLTKWAGDLYIKTVPM